MKKTMLAVGLALMLVLGGCSSAPDAETQAVIDSISAIGTVTIDSEDAITNALEGYNALEDKQKNKVDNYDALTDAQAAFDQLKADEAIKAIDAIGEVTLESQDQVYGAKFTFNALTDSQKELVTNADVLTAADDTLTQLQEEERERAKAFNVGDTVENDDWRVTLASAYVSGTLSSPSSRTYWEPSDGGTFLIMEFDIEALNSDHKTIDDDGLTDIVAAYNGNTYGGFTIQYVTNELWLYVRHTYMDANLPDHFYVYTTLPKAAEDDGQPISVTLKVGGEDKVITIR